MTEFDEDCRRLRPYGRDELSCRIERQALQLSDPDSRAVMTLALKHFDAGAP